jgi:hypothetical protein
LPTAAGCGSIEREIKQVNDWAELDKKGNRLTAGTRLSPEQWQRIKACAQPPAEVCFKTGNPWPFARYIKIVRIYKPDPSDVGTHKAILAWMEGEMAKCARYEMKVLTTASVKSDTAFFTLSFNARMKVTFRMDSSSPYDDFWEVADVGELTAYEMRCNVKGAKCSVVFTEVPQPARFRIAFSDLPVDGDNRGPGESGKFQPGLDPPFALVHGQIVTRAGTFTIPFELINSAWECFYAADKSALRGYFWFKDWTPGDYPVIYKLKRGPKVQTCGKGNEKGQWTLITDLEFKHAPNGAFTPMP